MVRRCRSRGAVLPLVALLAAGMLLGVLLLAAVLQRVVGRADCQHAADAAALAGVIEGRVGADRLAVANGGVVRWFAQDGNVAEVHVQCGSVTARANAERRLRPG